MQKNTKSLFPVLIIIIFVSVLIVFLDSDEKNNLSLTKEEKKWISENRTVLVSPTPSFPPIDFLEQEKKLHKGIAKDFLDKFSEMTGLEFKTDFPRTWEESLNNIKNKKTDIITSVQKTRERSEYLLFTKPYIKVKNILIVNSDSDTDMNLKKMKNKKLVIIKDYAVSEYIENKYPEIDTVYADNILDAMFFISMEKADAMVANVPVAAYFRSKNMIGNLKLAQEIDYEYNLSFGIRSDKPILHSIISKALNSLPEPEKEKIKNKWIGFGYKEFWHSRVFWVIFFAASAALILMFSISLLWRKKAFELASAKKEAEDARKKAEQADMSKSKFLANMSHEIRTPMNSVLGFAELLYEEVKSEKEKNYIVNIKNSGRSLLSLIDDILDMSKIETGKFKLTYSPTDIKRVVKDIESEFSFAVKNKGLDFKIEVSPDLPYYIYADELRLRQILINLAGNAVKFTSEGYIKIIVSSDTIHEDHRYTNLYFEINDSGIGIPETEHKAVFESFTQQGGQDAREYGGTGLGLSITKKLVELMNGEIRLDSRPGFGSSFYIVLKNVEVVKDFKSLPLPEPKKITSKVTFLKKAEILIAEDAPSNREILSEYLKPFDFKIFEVESGKEVINFLKKRKPDIILLDMNIGDKNGYEVIKFLEDNDLINKIMVIAISGDFDTINSSSVRSRGVSGYLKKPYMRDELINELVKFIPYTVDENGQRKPELRSESDYLNRHDLKRIYENSEFDYFDFCSYFDVYLMNKWSEADNPFIISDISEFADDLIKAGENFEAQCFKDLGEDIKIYADDFDIEKLKPLMQLFPKLLKRVKKIYEEE
jgi:signal transduction histidine kinase/CheY-like chemotaxis protein